VEGGGAIGDVAVGPESGRSDPSGSQGGRHDGANFDGQNFGDFQEGFFEGNYGYGNNYGAMNQGNFIPRPYNNYRQWNEGITITGELIIASMEVVTIDTRGVSTMIKIPMLIVRMILSMVGQMLKVQRQIVQFKVRSQYLMW
jgi:hypothetical protein